MTRRLEVSIPGYCVGVNFRKHRVIWGGWGTLFVMLHGINGCDPVLTMPCGRNVSLWVGGLDVKANLCNLPL
jgi:hypothetical protein